MPKGVFTRQRKGRMKPCMNCGTAFYCEPSRDDGGTLMKRKYCSTKCDKQHKFHSGGEKERFWTKVHKGERCWIWMGAKHFRGYGACGTAYGDCRAHRVAWIYTNGSIPKGLGVLHRCDTPLCVNPFHLYLGDQKANAADKKARGRIGNRYQPIHSLLHPHLSLRGKLTNREQD